MYDGTDLSGLDVDTIEVGTCRFERVNVSETRIRHGMFSDALFERCDLANVNAADSSLLNSHFAGCRLTGLSWTNGLLREVLFEDCRMNLAGFRFTRFKPVVVFRNCELGRVNFQNADLTGARFERCDLTGAQFSNAKMTGARFEECTLLDISGVTSFNGAIVKSGDALGLAYTLAGALGITIEE